MTDATTTPSPLLTVGDIAVQLQCSTRHVHRLKDYGRMPAPVHLGGLVRWSRTAITQWIANGCPNCQDCQKGGRQS